MAAKQAMSKTVLGDGEGMREDEPTRYIVELFGVPEKLGDGFSSSLLRSLSQVGDRKMICGLAVDFGFRVESV